MSPDAPDPDDRRAHDAEREAALQDKKAGNPRPDQPTPSDDATLVERDEGAHAEFSTAPSTLDDPPPPDDGHPDDEDEQRRG